MFSVPHSRWHPGRASSLYRRVSLTSASSSDWRFSTYLPSKVSRRCPVNTRGPRRLNDGRSVRAFAEGATYLLTATYPMLTGCLHVPAVGSISSRSCGPLKVDFESIAWLKMLDSDDRLASTILSVSRLHQPSNLPPLATFRPFPISTSVIPFTG